MENRPAYFKFASFFTLALLLITANQPVSAVDKYWICADGLWSDTSCWSLTSNGTAGASVPQATDRVFLNSALAQDYTISYSGPDTGTLGNIVLQKTGLGTPELLNTGSILDTDALRTATAGTYTQTGGSLLLRKGDVITNRSDGLLLGVFGGGNPGDVNTLNLSGGLIDAPYTSFARSGDVVVNHSGGTFDAGFLEVEGSATYNLSGTGELIATDITGNGAFTQTGGSITVTNGFSGTIDLQAGTINASSAAVAGTQSGGSLGSAGNMTVSNFTQTGGTVAVNSNLLIGSLYDLQAGTLSVDSATVSSATFNVSAGSTFNYNDLSLNGGTISGLETIDSGKTLSVSSGLWNGNLNVGTASAGAVTLGGGTINGSFDLGASGTAGINNVEITDSLTLDGTVTSIGNVIVGGGIINNTSITLSSDLTSNGAAGLDNNNTIALAGNSITTTGPVTNDGDISGSGAISSGNNFSNTGTIIGAIAISSSGQFNNSNLANADSITISGVGGVSNTAQLTLIGGISGADAFTNTGVASLGSLINVSGTGGILNDGQLTLVGGDSGSGGLINNNQLTLTGTMSGSGGLTNNGQLNLTGTISGAGGFTNNGQLIQGSGAINLANSDGNINNGTIELAFDRGLSLNAADFTNNSVLNMRNNTISGTANLVNSATGTINGNGRTAVNIVNAGTINARSGNLSIAGSNFTNTGLVKNSVGSNLFIDAISVSHTGSIETNANGSVVFNSAISNASGQTITLNGGTLSTPTLTNTAGGTVSGFGTISGDVNNSGQVDLFGASTISGALTNQSSGNMLIRNDTTLITGPTINNGTIETLNGNVIFEGGLTNNGALLFDPSTLTLSDLTVSNDGFLAESGDPGDRIIITGDMVNQSTRNTSWQTTNTFFQFNGGTRDVSNPQFLEVAGTDIGNTLAGWTDNFAFGTLEIGTSDTYVKLVDDSDNSAMCLTSYCEIWSNEALYVGDFILEPGAHST